MGLPWAPRIDWPWSVGYWRWYVGSEPFFIILPHFSGVTDQVPISSQREQLFGYIQKTYHLAIQHMENQLSMEVAGKIPSASICKWDIYTIAMSQITRGPENLERPRG